MAWWPLTSQNTRTSSPKLEHLTIEDGLSQGFISDLCQDDDGFLWFGTWNGLNRYDGYRFQIHKHDPFNPWSLPANEIHFFEPVGDFLLINAGITWGLFHRKLHKFIKISNLDLQNYYFIRNILPDGDHAVYLYYVDQNMRAYLARLSWPPDIIQRAEQGEQTDGLWRTDYLPVPPSTRDVAFAADRKSYWILNSDEIRQFDPESGNIRAVPLPASLSTGQNMWYNQAWLLLDLAGAIWVSEKNRLWRFDGKEWQCHSLPFMPDRVFLADRENDLIWYLKDAHILGIDAGKQPFSPLPAHDLKADAAIRNGIIDNNGNLWMGTDARGIRKFSPRTNFFNNYLDACSVYSPPLPDGRGNVLLTDLRPYRIQPGMLDLRTGSFRTLSQLGLHIPQTRQAYCVENGRYWIFFGNLENRPGTLIRYDPAGGSIEEFPLPVLPYSVSTLLKYVEPGQIWIASLHALARFDVTAGTLSLFQNPLVSPDMQTLCALERSPDGVWWLGTDAGLLKAEPDGRGGFRFTRLLPEPGNHNSLPGSSIKSLRIDPADPGVLWIGTNGQGLSRWDLKHDLFTHYTMRNGLPDDTVYGILTDDATPRNLWLSTNRGLARFNPEAGAFLYFFKSDGLPENEFNTYAAAKSPAGELLFGGVNGLTVFHPGSLSGNVPPPAVHLTGLEINGRSAGPLPDSTGTASLGLDIAFLNRIELPFDQNSLVLHFAATDYTSPERNQFAFYLEGAEAPWIHRGLDHTAQYLNLAPGSYRFRVKAANSNGIWGEESVSLQIVILPPWYRTWAAWLAYAALLAGAVFLLYKNQLRRRLEHAEARRLRELDEFKSRFFTNITHEFRTPLTVILGNLEMEKQEIERQAADVQTDKTARFLDFLRTRNTLTRRNAESLLRLINQMLDLAKLESRTLSINYLQGDVLAYVRYIAESLHSLANAQNVLLKVESDQARIVMDYDPERLLQIVYNLLSNAVKFTPSGGQVNLRVTVDGTGKGRPAFAVLQVADTGAGIPAEDLPHIFDRFYQAKNLEKAKTGGTGIGLALTKELVLAMGGDIAVESSPGRGAVFTVRLPVTNRAAAAAPSVSPYPSVPGTESVAALPPLPEKGGSPEAEPVHLLIVEDNPDVVEYLAACLRGKYALDFAYNGRAGIEKALETIPDLIVSDVMMPERDGFEVCSTLKNDERTSHIPVVLLTAKAGVENRIAGLRQGADAYLAKPFHQEELLVTVANLLEQRERLRLKYRNWMPATGATPEAPASADPENAFLQKVAACLERHLDDADFGVPQLSRAMGISQSQLYRKIKALTDLSTAAFIRRIRLQKGRQLLETTGLTVAEVAYAVGFNTPNYFSDAFAEEYGARPHTIRN